uniref:STAS domain-containing protein n=1 Tax=Aegilops tauschii subsp. strangulata TaxID=200361 RepID=A0A453ITY2_AEGTS
GTVAVASLLIASMLGAEVSATENPALYLHLAFTATFFAGVIQASLGILRLGFIVDFLSHAAIVGFMGGAATVVCLQQLKGMLGLEHFTTSTDLVSVMRSVFSQTHQSKRQPRFFWVSAAAPLTSVILGSLLVYFTHAENHGVQIIGNLKKGLNPISVTNLQFTPPYMMLALKTGLITGVIALAEGIAVGRSFAMFKNYHIDGNKEMIAIGTMNILGSFTSCYLTTGPFSRSAVNYNAGCKTAMSNVIMSLAVMVTLLFLTPLFHYTPLVVLSAIIMSAMLGLIDFPAAVHLWHVDKVDFCVCAGAYLGVVFGSVEMGLVVAVAISVLRVLLFVARPRTTVLGNVPDTNIYRRMDQYTTARTVPGVLVLRVDSPIYFANSGYLRERFTRWIDEDDERTSAKGETGVQYVVLDMGGKLQTTCLKNFAPSETWSLSNYTAQTSRALDLKLSFLSAAVGSIDTSGTSMLDELKKTLDRRGIQIVLANPGSEIMKKLESSKVLELIGHEWIFPTVGEAVAECDFVLHSHKPGMVADGASHENMV